MANIKLKINNIGSPHCERLIKDSLNELFGVIDVWASYKQKIAKVSFDDSFTDKNKIKLVLEEEGFKVG